MTESAVPVPESGRETDFTEQGKQVYKIGLHKLSLPQEFYITTLEEDAASNNTSDGNPDSLEGKIKVYHSLLDEIIDVMIEMKSNLYVGRSSILQAMFKKSASSNHGALYGVVHDQVMVRGPGIEFILGTIYRAKNSKKS